MKLDLSYFSDTEKDRENQRICLFQTFHQMIKQIKTSKIKIMVKYAI